jgi:3D (Asp-Asp-Asp) domain-containing protein
MDDRTWNYVVGGVALGVAAFWWRHRNEAGSLVDKLADAVVTLTSTDEQRLAQLEPVTQAQVRRLIDELAARGIQVKVGQTLRDSAQERALIEAGRTAGSLKVSWHQLGRAVDLYPIDPDTGKWDRDGNRVDLFLEMARTAESLGFRQLGFNADDSKRLITNANGDEIWDGGHIEWRAPYGSITEAVAAEGERFGLA